jgi:hypothetical protein
VARSCRRYLSAVSAAARATARLEPCLASRDELGELLQRAGALELAAAAEAEVENMPTRSLELGIFERLRLVERSPVPMVAGVERPPLDKVAQSQLRSRHVEESRTESGLLPPSETLRTEMS